MRHVRVFPRELVAATTVLLLVALPGIAAHADIEVSPTVPVQGREVTVRVTRDGEAAAGAAVKATYRPGSRVSHTEALGRTDDQGRLGWTPTDAGIVTLQADLPADGAAPAATVSRNLSVHFQGVPWSGVLIMILAGTILYGGVFLGFRRLTSGPRGLPPDT